MDEVKQHIDENAKGAYIDWIRGEGPSPEEAILEHVSSCLSCKTEILELAEILDGVDLEAKPEKANIINMKLILRAVALLAGVMAVALIIQFLRPEKADLEVAQLDKDSIQQHTPENQPAADPVYPKEDVKKELVVVIQHDTLLYAENFKPNPGLESLVNARFRSAKSGNTQKDLISEVLLKGSLFEVDFSGIENPDLELVLVSNSGINLKTIVPTATVLEVKFDFEPGLYYWKLISSDEILHVGRFRIYSDLGQKH